MERTTAKKMLKVALAIYLLAFLVINWDSVSWMFSYRAVSGMVSNFFNPYPSIDASSMNAYFYPNHSQPVISETNSTSTSQVVVAPQPTVKTTYTDKQNTLEIPAISVETKVTFSASTDVATIENDLKRGVVFYPGSVYPGQNGQIVILGHSAPPGWPNARIEGVFTDLEKLVIGDKVFLDLNNKQYTYIVKEKSIIKKGADVPTSAISANNNVLTLISCWPPGKNYQRIAIVTELQR